MSAFNMKTNFNCRLSEIWTRNWNFIILEATLKISNCVTCFFEKQGICLIKKLWKKIQIKIPTFLKYSAGILNIPIAGSIVSSTRKETLGWNQAHVIWTHSPSISVGLRAPPEIMKKGIEVKSLKQDKQTGQLNKLKAPIVKQNVKKRFILSWYKFH